jgi:hypothetical protein
MEKILAQWVEQRTGRINIDGTNWTVTQRDVHITPQGVTTHLTIRRP